LCRLALYQQAFADLTAPACPLTIEIHDSVLRMLPLCGQCAAIQNIPDGKGE
jgi:hypothetical protein